MKLTCLLLFLSFTARNLFSQKADSLPVMKNYFTTIFVGVSQFKNTYFEAGLEALHGRYAHNLSIDYNPRYKIGGINISTRIIGPLSIRSNMFFGVNLNSYLDFTDYNLGFKPYVGVNRTHWYFSYGYNFQLIDKGVDNINRHVFSLRYYFK